MQIRELKEMLSACGLTQRGAAKSLGINERTMRRYIAGDLQIPVVVELALNWIELANRQLGNRQRLQKARKGREAADEAIRAKQVD